MDDDTTRPATESQPPSEEHLEQRWEEAGSDPDLLEDLGYDLEKLDVLVTSNNDKKVMVLPRAKEWVEEDDYMIADFELACDPIDRA